MKPSQLFRLMFNAPLLIEPGRLSAVAAYLAGETATQSASPVQLIDGGAEAAPEAEEQARPYRVTSGGVAVIPVVGVLVHRESWWSDFLGCTGYGRIAAKLKSALADDAVRAILLDIDSPGGQVSGMFALADKIREAGTQKPVWAAANEEAYSAAYALGSSAQKLFLPSTAGVGSIGVVWMHLDQSGSDEMRGLKYEMIFSGARKIDYTPHKPLNKKAYAAGQTEVDRLRDLFVAAVARNRGLEEQAVRDTEAALYYGPDAVDIGLADGVAGFDEILQALTKEIQNKSLVGTGALTAAAQTHNLAMEGDPMKKRSEEQAAAAPESPATTDNPAASPAGEAQAMPPAPAAESAPESPGTDQAAIDAAVKKALAADRSRQAAILDCEEAAGREKLAKHLAYNTDMGVEEAKAMLLAAPKAEAPAPTDPLTAAMAAYGDPAVGGDDSSQDPDSEAAAVAFAASSMERLLKERNGKGAN